MFKYVFIHIRKNLLLATALAAIALNPDAQASELSAGASVAPPIGYMRFCMMNPADCRTAQKDAPAVRLNSWRWAELQAVQKGVNRQVRPRHDAVDGRSRVADNWEYPRSGYGDCEDYALAKRQALIQRGWSSRALRFVTVRTNAGEPHVVLAVTTSAGDFILDNRYPEVYRWESLDYQWLAVQDRDNPLRWRVAKPAETAVASLNGNPPAY